jgi:diguanylate cyclase (GGDEF)-like protein
LSPDIVLPGRVAQPPPSPEDDLFNAARLRQVSHDLRTPLTVILGYAELLQGGDPREDQRQGLDALVTASSALRAAVEQLIASAGNQLGIPGAGDTITALHGSPARTGRAMVDVTELRDQQAAIDQSIRIGEPLLLEVVEKQRLALAALRLAANTDYLSGIGNKRALEHRLSVELGRAERHLRPLSILMVDIDAFKTINDRLGHLGGDIVIAAVARRLATAVRMEDEVARVGGDEFMVVCPETNSDSARAIARKLAHAVSMPPLETPRGPLTVRVSIGCASTSEAHTTRQELMAAADKRLYAAKHRRHRRAGVAV